MKPIDLRALDAIFDPLDSSSAPGGAVGVEVGGQVAYARGFGLASIESGLEMTPHTRVRIGSTSKQFCALAAMLLADDGRLDVDAPLRTYLPELHPELPPVTVRQAMNHTGGLRCFLDLTLIANGLMAPLPSEQVLPLIARQLRTNFVPGTRFAYSNSGMRLVSLIIERVSGQPLEVFLRERVFGPLSMLDTQLQRHDLDMLPNLASLHVNLPGMPVRRGVMPTDVLGEGGLVSTVCDLLRWSAHLRDPRVGSPATWCQMREPPAELGADAVYGLGLVVETRRGVKVVHHAGGVYGGNSQLLVAPDHGIGIAVLVNRLDVNSIDLAWRVLDTLLGEELEPAAASITSPEAHGLAGFYVEQSTGQTCALQWHGDALCWDASTAMIPLVQHDDGFALAYASERRRIRQAADGMLEVEQHGHVQRYERHECGSAERWLASLVGRYHCVDVDALIRIDPGHDAPLEVIGPYGRTRWRLAPLLAADAAGQSPPEFWLLTPASSSLTRWAALRVRTDEGCAIALELTTPRTWGLCFARRARLK